MRTLQTHTDTLVESWPLWQVAAVMDGRGRGQGGGAQPDGSILWETVEELSLLRALDSGVLEQSLSVALAAASLLLYRALLVLVV